jgi:hypothetical protein
MVFDDQVISTCFIFVLIGEYAIAIGSFITLERKANCEVRLHS